MPYCIDVFRFILLHNVVRINIVKTWKRFTQSFQFQSDVCLKYTRLPFEKAKLELGIGRNKFSEMLPFLWSVFYLNYNNAGI